MNDELTEVMVREIPDCDICKTRGKKTPAAYDAQIPTLMSWGYLCEACFKERGCKLGTGRGQKLVLKSKS